jgi:hypothetical protein
MKPWYYLPDSDSKSGKRLSFIRGMESDDSHELITVANTVFAALWPVVRPLSVDLTIAARQLDPPVIDKEIPVPVSNWRLYERYPPVHVTIPKWAELEWANPSYYREEEISELTPQALADWSARAHIQQLPEGYVPILGSLHMNYTRARILQDQEPYAELAWRWSQYRSWEICAVPVEKREDGFWVSGPMREGMIMNPPIAIDLSTCEGDLKLDISVNWSPWVEAGSEEAELLKSCLRELEKQGWEAD